MSSEFDNRAEDQFMEEWLEHQGLAATFEDDREEDEYLRYAFSDEEGTVGAMYYDEQDELRREEMREEMEYHKQSQQDAADAAALARMTASICPECGAAAGEYDYEPADPSVGIMGGVYINECPTHGIFYTYDDATQEMEEKS